MSHFCERGSVLLVTLVLLMVVTLLAVSAVQDIAMETRTLARDLEQQRLLNAAEAGLREGERHLGLAVRPLEPCGTPPCFQGLASHNGVDFTGAKAYQGELGAPGTGAMARWYIRLIPSASTQPGDATYGEAAKTGGTFYYEVSSQAFFPHLVSPERPIHDNCTVTALCLRSVVVRTFVVGGS